MEKIRNRDGKNSEPGWKKFGARIKSRIRNSVSLLPVERGWKRVVGQKEGEAGLEIHTLLLLLLPPQLLQAPPEHS